MFLDINYCDIVSYRFQCIFHGFPMYLKMHKIQLSLGLITNTDKNQNKFYSTTFLWKISDHRKNRIGVACNWRHLRCDDNRNCRLIEKYGRCSIRTVSLLGRSCKTSEVDLLLQVENKNNNFRLKSFFVYLKRPKMTQCSE